MAATDKPLQAVVPYLTIAGAADAVEYYKKAFGAQVVMGPVLADDGKRIMHVQLSVPSLASQVRANVLISEQIRGSLVYISDDFPEWSGGKKKDPLTYGGSPVTLHLNVSDCDAAVEAARAALPASEKLQLPMPPADMFWGDRYALFVDPWGHRWGVTSPISAERTAAAKKAHEEHMAKRKAEHSDEHAAKRKPDAK